MKIDVVYEKADILKLVVEDLRRKGLKVRQGFTPTVKSPIEVKLTVETEDESSQAAPVPAPASPPEKPKAQTASTPEPAEEPDAPVVDMNDVLKQSTELVMTQPGKFERKPRRPLGPNEFAEFPEE